MIRKAVRMDVQPGKIDEYERRHNPIWPELHAALKEHGAHNYSIFYDKERNQLFAYLEIEDEAKFAKLADLAVCHKWWKDMTELLVSDSPEADKAREAELREVFHID